MTGQSNCQKLGPGLWQLSPAKEKLDSLDLQKDGNRLELAWAHGIAGGLYRRARKRRAAS